MKKLSQVLRVHAVALGALAVFALVPTAHAQYKGTGNTVESLPSAYKQCARVSQKCLVAPGQVTIYYGAGTKYFEFTGKGDFFCNNRELGGFKDPDPKVTKACYAKPSDGSDASVTSEAMSACIRPMITAYTDASNLSKKVRSIKGASETAAQRKAFEDAEKLLKSFYDSNKSTPLTEQNLKSCETSRKAFGTYTADVSKANDAVFKQYADGIKARDDAAAAPYKADVDTCAATLWKQLEAHNQMLAEARKSLPRAERNQVETIVDQVALSFRQTLDSKSSNYYTALNLKNCKAFVGNTEVKKVFDAAKVSAAKFVACIDKAKALQASNKTLKEDAEKNFGTDKDAVVKAWSTVDTKLSGLLDPVGKGTYTGDGKECEPLVANTDVKTAYDTAKAKVDAQSAAAAKAAAEKAKATAAANASSAAAAAERQKLADCRDDRKKRLASATSRLGELMQNGTATKADIAHFNTLHKAATEDYAATLQTSITFEQCKQPSSQFASLENFLGQLDTRRKQILEKQAQLDAELERKKEEEYKRWLVNNPKDISGACDKACTIRHAGAGPKQKECARECTVAKNAATSALNTALDEAFMKPFEAAMDRMGASKKLCEAAQSKVGKIIEEAGKQIDKLSGTVKEKSAGACTGSAAKCKYVANFIQTGLDVKSCTEASKSLAKSRNTVHDKLEKQKSGLAAAKSDSSKTSAFKDAAKDVIKDSAETCESAKASDLIAALIKPCTDAATGAAWLLTHAGDYK